VTILDGEKVSLAVSAQYRRVTDRQTDILRQYSPRYAEHRAVMTQILYFQAFQGIKS